MAVERLDHQTHILAYNPYNPISAYTRWTETKSPAESSAGLQWWLRTASIR